MQFPAVDVRGADPELALAVADDFCPSAVEELADGIAIFFRSADDRDRARSALARAFPSADVAGRDVDDEDWARRSQQNLTPITVSRVTVQPPWAQPDPAAVHAPGLPETTVEGGAITVVITPSMGFGTGHHATTRLCLAALQIFPVQGRQVLDVGTGSGVLAIAARRLGAAAALGIDIDPDAVASARENLPLNPGLDGVAFEVADLQTGDLPRVDVVLANLTGATLVQHASRLAGRLAPGGVLIVSGLLEHETDMVRDAFRDYTLRWSQCESGWAGLAFSAA